MPSDRMLEYYFAMGQDATMREDFDEAIFYFRKAAKLHITEAAQELGAIGYRYETGQDVSVDEKKAALCYKESADAGNAEAAFHLGRLYMTGIADGKPDYKKAKKYLEQASEAENDEAPYLLGRLYDEGMMGRVNPKRAFQYYLLAAERGCSAAMLMVGLCYAQGSPVPKDLTAAELWIRKGNVAGDADGAATLRTFLTISATEYASGAAGRLDDSRAFSMAAEAETMGNTEAFLLLGETYRSKNKMPGHGEKAFRCFLRAERHGIPAARAALGLCYESGLGTEPNIEKAISCYRDAAEKGNAFAMARLGYAYETGEGIEKNEKLAMSWLIRAAMQGDKGAILTLKDDYHYVI